MASRDRQATGRTHPLSGPSARKLSPTSGYTPSIVLPIHPQSPTQCYAPGARSVNHEGHDVNALNGRFPCRMFDMLEDEDMLVYVQWYRRGDLHGLFIPDIAAFVLYALPSYFPDINKWGSFQKQLNNYGFEKQDRSTIQALYTHWDNKFQRGRRDLLPEVVGKPDRRTRGSTRLEATQKQLPPPSPLDVVDVASQPTGQLDLHNRVIWLESDNKKLRNAHSGMVKTVAGMERRLEAAETRLEEVLNRISALSIGGGSFKPTGSPGTTMAMSDNHFPTNQPGNSGEGYAGFAPRAHGGAYNVRGSQGVPLHSGMGMSCDTINLDLLVGQTPQPQPSGLGTFGNHGLPLSYTGGQSTFGTPFPPNFLLQDIPQQQYNPATMYPSTSSFPQRQVTGLTTGTSTFSHNASAVVLTGQATSRYISSDSTGSSGKRTSFGGMFPVPPPPNPSSSRF